MISTTGFRYYASQMRLLRTIALRLQLFSLPIQWSLKGLGLFFYSTYPYLPLQHRNKAELTQELELLLVESLDTNTACITLLYTLPQSTVSH